MTPQFEANLKAFTEMSDGKLVLMWVFAFTLGFLIVKCLKEATKAEAAMKSDDFDTRWNGLGIHLGYVAVVICLTLPFGFLMTGVVMHISAQFILP